MLVSFKLFLLPHRAFSTDSSVFCRNNDPYGALKGDNNHCFCSAGALPL